MSTTQPAPLTVPLDPAAALESAQALARHWLERFKHEVDFARRLAGALPEESKGWEDKLVRAERSVGEAAGTGDAQKIKAAVEAAEKDLAAIGTVAKTFTIHCAGHAHIDMNWLWGWQETVATTVDTFETVLKLMEEFPTFCYTQSQASVYEIVREHCPEQFERIKAKVKEGRWEVAASHWVEGDQNLAGGEALCRHLLYTRRFMREHLGLKPEDVTVDWTPDTFGHARTIPAIDSRGGVKHMYMCRPGGDRPPVFWWKAQDGSKVLVNKETLWYNSELRPWSTHKLIEFHAKTGLRDWLQVYGVGDHGGGPTRRDLRCAVDMDGWPIFPNFKFATTKSFFAKLETAASGKNSTIPVIEEELNYEFAGCYTSQSSIKKANRHGENLMSEADIAATLAFTAIGREYPQQKLEKAWRDVLFSHFHDILPGSGIRQTREYNSAMFQGIQAVAGQVKTQSLRALAKAIDTSAGGKFQAPAANKLPEHESVALGAGVGRAVGEVSLASVVLDGPRAAVVFNPTAWKRDEVVRVTVWDMDTGPSFKPMNQRSYVAKAADGTVVPAQRVNEGGYWGHNFVDLAIPASVGGLGWTTYEIAEGEPPKGPWKCWGKKEAESGVNSPHGALEIENELVKVVFDRATGGIKSYVLKATGQDVADPANPLGVLEYIHERPVGMSAWILGDTQERRPALEIESMDLVQGGPHTAIVRVVAKITKDSKFTIHYDLTAGSPSLVINVDGWWLEKGSRETGIPRLAIRFPFALTGAKARYEIPYGSIARNEPANREVPALRWAEVAGQVGGKAGGCAVANDCKYGHSLDGSTLRVNIVRSSYDPDPLPEIGQQQARFALCPFTGTATAAELARLGAAFNHPLQAVVAPIHGGELPNAVSAASCAQANVVVTQLKRAEESNDLVFRLVELDGKATTAQVALDSKAFGRVASATEADVLERPASASSAKAKPDGFEVALPAYGIATVTVGVKR